MTADEWDACADPAAMLALLGSTETFRTRWNGPVVWARFGYSRPKVERFELLCAARIRHLLPPSCQRLLLVTEAYREGRVDQAAHEEAIRVVRLADDVPPDCPPDLARAIDYISFAAMFEDRTEALPVHTAAAWAVDVASRDSAADVESLFRQERARQADLLRCLIGNPLRPVALHRDWLTPNVLALARTAHDHREFDRLPVLADALRDAGCVEESLLAHCQSGGEHVLGCWVLEVLLGKE